MTTSKKLVEFVCRSCHASVPRWQGQCPECQDWNTLEERDRPKKGPQPIQIVQQSGNAPLKLSDVPVLKESWISSGISEFDHVLGDGLVTGSIVLLGGEPGIGKSTVALQLAQHVGAAGKTVLYVTGEESLSQLQLRSQRLGGNPDTLFVLSQNNIQKIKRHIESLKPDLVILDSIQVVYHPDVPSVPGSVNQVRQCAQDLISVLKSSQATGVLIGHITKEGQLAGPKVLEHLVDVVLFFEGDRNQQYRILRSYKNRYASTQEIGIFSMETAGLTPVENPSMAFIDESTVTHAGSVVAPVAEGSRVMLVEIQALVVSSGYGMAKRTMLGVDVNRANLLVAVLEKILGIPLSSHDIILNVIGGVKIVEPAIDLALMMAIMSSFKGEGFTDGLGVVGEVGLTGEIRAVSHISRRLKELQKMGFKKALIPSKNRHLVQDTFGLDLVFADHIQGAVGRFFGS